jgi:hypothetical protein
VIRPIDYLYILGVPIVLVALLVFVLISGRLPDAARVRIERVLGWLFWPLVTVYWTWRAVEFGLQGEWISMALMGAVAVVFGAQGLTAIRQGRFLPVRRPRAP